MVSHVLAQINSIRTETASRLNQTLNTVKSLIPHTNVSKRGKRSSLPFTGQFSRTLFGTATVDDVNVLARHINELNHRTMALRKL